LVLHARDSAQQLVSMQVSQTVVAGPRPHRPLAAPGATITPLPPPPPH